MTPAPRSCCVSRVDCVASAAPGKGGVNRARFACPSSSFTIASSSIALAAEADRSRFLGSASVGIGKRKTAEARGAPASGFATTNDNEDWADFLDRDLQCGAERVERVERGVEVIEVLQSNMECRAHARRAFASTPRFPICVNPLASCRLSHRRAFVSPASQILSLSSVVPTTEHWRQNTQWR